MRFFGVLVIVSVLINGCTNKNEDKFKENDTADIIQQDDGKIILKLDDAYLFQDSLHPELNTAEWLFKANSTGRYELWLTSLTVDTMDLHYDIPVIVNFCDKRIQAKPIGNEIVHTAPDSGDTLFRAKSKLGSVYIEEPGNYNIQVISDKLRTAGESSDSIYPFFTKFQSLILKPMTE